MSRVIAGHRVWVQYFLALENLSKQTSDNAKVLLIVHYFLNRKVSGLFELAYSKEVLTAV